MAITESESMRRRAIFIALGTLVALLGLGFAGVYTLFPGALPPALMPTDHRAWRAASSCLVGSHVDRDAVVDRFRGLLLEAHRRDRERKNWWGSPWASTQTTTPAREPAEERWPERCATELSALAAAVEGPMHDTTRRVADGLAGDPGELGSALGELWAEAERSGYRMSPADGSSESPPHDPLTAELELSLDGMPFDRIESPLMDGGEARLVMMHAEHPSQACRLIADGPQAAPRLRCVSLSGSAAWRPVDAESGAPLWVEERGALQLAGSDTRVAIAFPLIGTWVDKAGTLSWVERRPEGLTVGVRSADGARTETTIESPTAATPTVYRAGWLIWSVFEGPERGWVAVQPSPGGGSWSPRGIDSGGQPIDAEPQMSTGCTQGAFIALQWGDRVLVHHEGRWMVPEQDGFRSGPMGCRDGHARQLSTTRGGGMSSGELIVEHRDCTASKCTRQSPRYRRFNVLGFSAWGRSDGGTKAFAQLDHERIAAVWIVPRPPDASPDWLYDSLWLRHGSWTSLEGQASRLLAVPPAGHQFRRVVPFMTSFGLLVLVTTEQGSAAVVVSATGEVSTIAVET